MDLLRVSCWDIDDITILEWVDLVDSNWWDGLSYADQLLINAVVCDYFDPPCLDCWNAIARFIYEVEH